MISHNSKKIETWIQHLKVIDGHSTMSTLHSAFHAPNFSLLISVNYHYDFLLFNPEHWLYDEELRGYSA
jgi:hypothetical protein